MDQRIKSDVNHPIHNCPIVTSLNVAVFVFFIIFMELSPELQYCLLLFSRLIDDIIIGLKGDSYVSFIWWRKGYSFYDSHGKNVDGSVCWARENRYKKYSLSDIFPLLTSCGLESWLLNVLINGGMRDKLWFFRI